MEELNLKTITDYIISHYPDSCIAYNTKNREIYYEYMFEDCFDFFYYEKLNWCGCGDPELAQKVVKDYLNIITERDYNKQKELYQEKFNCKNVYSNPLLLCLAYTLDSVGFTEHGSSVGGAWLTEEGKMFLWLLNNKEFEEDN